jgi:hypothetical protein
VDPKKSAQAATGFTWQAVEVRLGEGSLGYSPRADRPELTMRPPSGLNDRGHVMNWQRSPLGGEPSGPCQSK